MKRKRKVDPVIMAELLEQPDVKPFVKQMTDDERAWYEELLVSEGIYDRYVKEREQR